MKNQHGLDTHYAEKNLRRLLRDINGMPADEYARTLIRLASCAAPEVLFESEFNPAPHDDAAPHPEAAEPVKLRFPTMLRKMWSGGEVQAWIDNQGVCLQHAAQCEPASNQGTDLRSDADLRDYQANVTSWVCECFGKTIADDHQERNHRFVEEALELAQAGGCSEDEVRKLVAYTFSRPVGVIGQEVGGVMVTLAALCTPHGVGMMEEGLTELRRISQPDVMERVRQKQLTKPAFSSLPGVYPDRMPVQIPTPDGE